MEPDAFELLQNFKKLRQALYDHVGFVDDWVVCPIQDNTDLPWCIVDGEYVKYADDMGGFMSEGKYYEDSVCKRYYPKAIYEGKDLTMVILDTHTDGMKFFAFFANKNRVD